MKTKDLVSAYNLLNEAKLTKMEDADKFKVIKALRVMKKTAKDYEDFAEDAQKKLQGENHEEMQKRAQEWNEKHKGAKISDLTTEEQTELADINKYYKEYGDKVAACVNEEAEKDVKTEFDKLSEDAFSKLVASNDWTCGQIMQLSDVIAE